MKTSAANAQKLLEVFRENESDLPGDVYKAMVDPLVTLCEQAFNYDKDVQQAEMRKKLMRLLEDNPTIFSIDPDYMYWLQARLPGQRVSAVSHGFIRVEESAAEADEEGEEDDALTEPLDWRVEAVNFTPPPPVTVPINPIPVRPWEAPIPVNDQRSTAERFREAVAQSRGELEARERQPRNPVRVIFDDIHQMNFNT